MEKPGNCRVFLCLRPNAHFRLRGRLLPLANRCPDFLLRFLLRLLKVCRLKLAY